MATDALGAVVIAVKAVPGARRSEVAGRLGDRLKLRLAAPAEEGRANAALCRLLAEELGVKEREVEVIAGQSAAEKLVRVRGRTARDVESRW